MMRKGFRHEAEKAVALIKALPSALFAPLFFSATPRKFFPFDIGLSCVWCVCASHSFVKYIMIVSNNFFKCYHSK